MEKKPFTLEKTDMDEATKIALENSDKLSKAGQAFVEASKETLKELEKKYGFRMAQACINILFEQTIVITVQMVGGANALDIAVRVAKSISDMNLHEEKENMGAE